MDAAALKASNLRGAGLMVVAMGFFALTDMMIKLMAASLPVGQILMVLGAGGSLAFAALLRARGRPVVSRDALLPGVIWRNLLEMAGTFSFVTALSLVPLALASIILQAVPLIVTLGAALLLGDRVGWRRWAAIGVGFFGVLLVIRPGTEGFSPEALWALAAATALALRDVAARTIPPRVGTLELATWAFAVLVPAGAAALWFAGDTLAVASPATLGQAALAVAFMSGAYYTLVGATRTGEVGFVAPFRYSRVVFALAIGLGVFGERLDGLALVGAGIVVASGLYAFWRERRIRED